jgi:hypothetical protein
MTATSVASIACVGCFLADGPTSTACHHETTMLAIKAGEANRDTSSRSLVPDHCVAEQPLTAARAQPVLLAT